LTIRVAALKRIPLILCAALLFALAACGGQQPAGSATPTPQFNIDDLLVYVPAGSFYMGSDVNIDPLARLDEFPQHIIRLDGFHIFRNEVSNDLYAQCVAAGHCSSPTVIPDGPSTHYGEEAYKNNPVVGVDWNQAVAFCTWVDARLPTEAEWEKTARGEFANPYPWGVDNPTCDLSNMEGCIVDPANTDQIGQHPGGESTYHANDMSGNVWEWTADKYSPDYYGLSPNVNPLGPEGGDLKVVRGGSFMDGPVDLRSAARLGLKPDQGYNDVGFRCVPIGMPSAATAPFCKSAYVPFCNDPKNPNQDCTPTSTGQQGAPTAAGDNPDFLGFTCPQGGYISFTMDGAGHSAGEFSVTIYGNPYDCIDTAGHILCTGTALSQNTIATIQVCPAPDAQNGGAQLAAIVPTAAAQPSAAKLVSFTPPQQQDAQLVAYAPPQAAQPQLVAYAPQQAAQAQLQGAQLQAPQLHAFQAATNNNCPDGMAYNPDSGQCETDPNGDACPDGWTYNPDTYKCEPSDGGCPQGTTYNADKQACTPDNGGDCPSPYTYDTQTETCQPPSNNDGGGACPAGYFYDQTISCCSPIKGDNNGCGQGSYFSVAAGGCQPLDQDGCGDGQSYNPYEGGCVPDTGDGSDQNTSNGDCRQAGYIMNAQGACVPANGPTANGPTDNGPTDGQDCGPNAYYDYSVEQCIGRGDNQCGAGYYYDANMQTCRPTDGPGSPCATGYAFNTALNCCSPTPGTDGSTCPGDQQGNANGNELVTFPGPSATNYDYGQGYCDPGTNGDGCPGGYYFDTEKNACYPIGDDTTPTNPDGSCGDGFGQDSFFDVCYPIDVQPTVNGCGEGQYFDYNLGYCVSTSCGCALGYYLNTDTKTCMPNGQDQTGEPGCVTFTASVPVCGFTPEPTPDCDKGTTYVPSTGKCERDVQTTPVSCSSYGSQSACKAGGCTWVVGTTSYCTN
jgi:formylglycine-generating enzyme required for sulfatase activity